MSGAYASFRLGGGCIYLDVSKLPSDRKSLRDYMQRTLGQRILFDSNEESNASLTWEKVQKVLSELPRDQVILAYGIDYSSSMAGFIVVMMIRSPEDFAMMKGLHVKTVVTATVTQWLKGQLINKKDLA